MGIHDLNINYLYDYNTIKSMESIYLYNPIWSIRIVQNNHI